MRIVLVVDDRPDARYTMTRPLAAAGFAVREAATGHDALQLARSQTDAIVMDIALPDMDGFEVLRRLKDDPLTKNIPVILKTAVHRDDEHCERGLAAGAAAYFADSFDPYALVAPITRIIRELSAEQPVERPATLEDVRAEVLAPNRLNALVFGGFATVALTIAIVGVAGVLAFSVSARTREFGIRLAIGSAPMSLLTRVLKEGAAIAGIGIVVGAIGGFLLTRAVGAYITEVRIPGALPIVAAALILVVSAVLASLVPAARASRVDVIDALRPE